MWGLLLVGADVAVKCAGVFKRRSPKTFIARVLNLDKKAAGVHIVDGPKVASGVEAPAEIISRYL